MEISMLGNFNAVNRGLLTHNQDDSDKEVHESSDLARTNETLSTESQISRIPPVNATEEIPENDPEPFHPHKESGRQINIKI